MASNAQIRTDNRAMVFMLVSMSLIAASCATEPVAVPYGKGSLRMQLSPGVETDLYDITGFYYEIYRERGDLLRETYVPLADMPFPVEHFPNDDLDPGQDHAFSDAFFVLPPGQYLVRVTPMISEAETSDICAAIEQVVDVVEEETAEVVLVLRCQAEANGALGVVAVLDRAPVSGDLVFDPGNFINTCEELTVTVLTDADDDREITWEIENPPTCGSFTFEPDDETLVFMSRSKNSYIIKVTACDQTQDCASLTFSVHVSLGDDENGCLIDTEEDTNCPGNSPGWIEIPKSTYAPNEEITVTWNIPNPTRWDWICHYEHGQATDSYGPTGWGTLSTGCGYTNDTSGHGTMRFPAPSASGIYDIRLYFDDEWGPDGDYGNTGESNIQFTVGG